MAEQERRERRATTRSKVRRSKTGCESCRQRKVRCDESKPRCQACTRLQLPCRYVDGGPRQQSSRYRVRFAGNNTRESNTEHSATGPMAMSAPAMPIVQSAGGFTSLPALEGAQSMANFDFDPEALPSALDDVWNLFNIPADTNFDFGLDAFPYLNSDSGSEHGMSVQFQGRGATAGIELGQHVQTEPSVFSPQVPKETAQYTPPGVPPASPSFVEIKAGDQDAIKHYLNTMVKFSKLRGSNDENVYSFIFAEMGLSHPTLFHAMMAWSSLHLAQASHQSEEEAAQRYRLASSLLYSDSERLEHVDISISTIWFLLQYEILKADGVDNFCNLLNFAADLLRSVFLDGKDQATARLGPVAIRAVVWMSAYDARAAYFGRAGKLLQCLRECPFLYDLLDRCGEPVTSSSSPPSSSLHSKRSHGRSKQAQAKGSAYHDCLRLAVRLRIVTGQINLLNHRKTPSDETALAWRAVESSIRTLEHEVDNNRTPAMQSSRIIAQGGLNVKSHISPQEYNYLMLLATYYGALLRYHQCKPEGLTPPPPGPAQGGGSSSGGLLALLLPPAECALRIIRIAHQATASRPDSPQAVWPNLLFIAGTACADPIYQAWVLDNLESAEGWGRNFEKTRVLLEHVLERQNTAEEAPHGRVVDFIAVMERTTGYFVI